ncbi:MAG: endopeptidase La [Oscillospiraceae bacterium]|nr:endopeptidase La [Oscillospiraceae bacterium]
MIKIEYENKTNLEMPMLALRGLSVFPDMSLNFDVERIISLNALNAAMERNRQIFLLTQKDIMADMPTKKELYTVGTVCHLRQLLRIPGGGVKVLVEGMTRAKLVSFTSDEGYFSAQIVTVKDRQSRNTSVDTEAMIRKAFQLFSEYARLTGTVAKETVLAVFDERRPGFLADYIAQNTSIRVECKQQVLETLSPLKRLEYVCEVMSEEVEIARVEKDIDQKLLARMGEQQRTNILREQLGIIRSELGMDAQEDAEFDEYRERIRGLSLPEEVETKLLKEVDKLEKQPYGSAETSVLRNYLDACLELPWNVTTGNEISVEKARKILERDHYGLEKVKTRILEYLAVRQYSPKARGSILCFVGPPGTGKTSVAISIAEALGRKLARVALGGVHDEAEIRGHRKTYVGAMPGRIMAAITQCGSSNPLMLLDEIDKLGSDYRGDPSAALLEALDPEQNARFRDHFLEIPFDLSDVLFITTANDASRIPRPLLDRMEVIELPSYTDLEKLQIAKRHLIPKQRSRHGLDGRKLRFTDEAVAGIIAGYTRESGVRLLEREIASVCRKTVAGLVAGEFRSLTVRPDMLQDLLGPKKITDDAAVRRDEVGLVNGLAWTSVGGELLQVEVNAFPGSGVIETTGNLGQVMKESAKAAVSYIRSRATALGLDPDFYKNTDIHIHFPEGAVPKDGPSAGITMTMAVISALTATPVRHDLAMTGEITLRGRVLAIGGLREKTMAALRHGITTVIIPADNVKDLDEIDPFVREKMHFVPATYAEDVIELVMPSLAERKPAGKHKKRAGAESSETRSSVRQ